MRILIYLFLVTFALAGISCEKIFFDPEPDNSPESIFEQVWKFADEEYSFFSYKNIDWDSVYNVYSQEIQAGMTEEELFDVLAEMLFLLKDGHVNLKSPFDRSRNWFWYLDYPQNYNYSLLERNYFRGREQYAGPFILVDFDDAGYIHYRSFGNRVSDENMDYVLEKFKQHQGLIIDLRNNGGGSMSNAIRIARRFAPAERIVALRQDKNGPGHEDFTEKYKISIDPSGKDNWTKPVVILANRLCYSATNYMIAIMAELPNVTIIGDRSGGGGGIPAYTELSNGWLMRVSSTRIFTPDGFNIEGGIPPDIRKDLTREDLLNNRDTLLEYALKFLRDGG